MNFNFGFKLSTCIVAFDCITYRMNKFLPHILLMFYLEFPFPNQQWDDSTVRSIHGFTGKSLSEALIFASPNPQYDNRLFIELRVQYLKIQNWGKHVVYRNCFLHSEEFLYTTIFSPCSAKRRASDKELSVLKTKTIWHFLNSTSVVFLRSAQGFYVRSHQSLWGC